MGEGRGAPHGEVALLGCWNGEFEPWQALPLEIVGICRLTAVPRAVFPIPCSVG